MSREIEALSANFDCIFRALRKSFRGWGCGKAGPQAEAGKHDPMPVSVALHELDLQRVGDAEVAGRVVQSDHAPLALAGGESEVACHNQRHLEAHDDFLDHMCGVNECGDGGEE